MQKKTLKLAIIGAVLFVLTVMCTAVAVRHMVLTEVRSAETADLSKPEEVLAVAEEQEEQDEPLEEEVNGADWMVVNIQPFTQQGMSNIIVTARQSGLVVNDIRVNDGTCGVDQGGQLMMDGAFRAPKKFGKEMIIGESIKTIILGNNCRMPGIFNAIIYTNKGDFPVTFQ